MYEPWYNVLVICCLVASIGMFIWVVYAIKDEILKRSDAKTEKRRNELRKSSDVYRYDYWKARNRTNLWDYIENEGVYHRGK